MDSAQSSLDDRIATRKGKYLFGSLVLLMALTVANVVAFGLHSAATQVVQMFITFMFLASMFIAKFAIERTTK